MRILSIDFDYFIDTNISTRNDIFPDGADYMPIEELKEEWKEVYKLFPEVSDIGLIKDFDYICAFLKNCRKGKYLIHNSHAEIGRLFPLIPKDENLELINIDFHHDNYVSSGKLDCANWVRYLADMRENLPTNIKWVKIEDSQTTSMIGDFPYAMTENIREVTGEFDYIFICYSPEWTPPHLFDRYVELCDCVKHLEKVEEDYD